MDFDLDDPVLLEQNAKIQAKAKKQPKAGKKGATFDSANYELQKNKKQHEKTREEESPIEEK